MRRETDCCIAGGGPAGMMLGFLLARAGISVVVLEKHPDFLRDFRGDTIHPSTLEVMHELGLLESFLTRPHQKVRSIRGIIDGEEIVMAELTHLPVRCPYIAFMPQWDFLDFLADEAKKYPHFTLLMQSQVTSLIEEDGAVRGVRAMTKEGEVEIRAGLTVGADGRHSTVRTQAGLPVADIGAPIDVLWMRFSRRPDESDQVAAQMGRGKIFVMLYRGDYWQCAYVIPKGGFEALKAEGLDRLRMNIAAIAPVLADRVQEIAGWDDVKLLTVTIDRLVKWHRPGLLCIGDAAHAMSPVGGVGVNLAVQDAVAAANLLIQPLRHKHVSAHDLARVQQRREWPTMMTQRLQLFVQNRLFAPVMKGGGRVLSPRAAWIINHLPFLRRIPARLIGMGFRPEHIQH